VILPRVEQQQIFPHLARQETVLVWSGVELLSW
jgi:hypothetical protein